MTVAERQPAAPTPTHEELIARACAILPTVRQNSAQGEQQRRIVEESIQAMENAGLFKIAVPRRYGGYETSLKTMLEVSSVIAEGDGGTAWVLALTNVCNWLTGLFSERVQDQVFRQPNVKVTGVLTPTASTRKVEGSYRVTGRWGDNSGSLHADWAFLGIPVVDEAGNVVDQGAALIPRADLTLEDTWFVSGMRGSGSNTVVAEDVFVADERVLSVPGLMMGRAPSEHLADEPLYRSSLIPVLALILVGPQLGMGRAALEYVREKAHKKAIAYTFFAQQAKSTAFGPGGHDDRHRAPARLPRRAGHRRCGAARGDAGPRDPRARIRADTGWAAEHITRAIDLLMSAHGSGGFAEVSPLQRLWRDSAIAARHAIVMPIVGYEIYGKALLGVEEQITPLV